MAEETDNAKPQNNRRRLLMQIAGAAAVFAAGSGAGIFLGPMVSGSGEADASAETAIEGEGHGEAPAEGEAKAEGEGHGEAKAEGHGEAKAEGEGHGEAKAEAGGHGEPAKETNGALAALDNGRVITNLKTFVVNLRSSGGGRVLRMEVQVESSQDVAPVLEIRMPRLRDTILTAVSDYTFAELEGTDGKTRLRDELLTRINGAMAPMTVDQVYFTQFVIQ